MRASYGQLGSAPEPSSRRRRVGCISVLLATLLLVVGVVLVAVLVPRGGKGDSGNAAPKATSAASQVCAGSANPPLCNSVLAGAPNASTPQQWVQVFVDAFKGAVHSSIDLVNQSLTDAQTYNLPNATTAALGVCSEVLGYSVNHLESATQQLHNLSLADVEEELDGVQSYLSAAATGLETCLDELLLSYNMPNGSYNSTTLYPNPATDPVSNSNTTHYTSDLGSIALSFIDYITQVTGGDLPVDLPFGLRKRRLLHAPSGEAGLSEFPAWMRTGARRALLQLGTTQPNKVVAKDGSGDYTTIQAAVNAAPSKSDTLFVIFIGAGTYREQVTIRSAKTNIAFVGAGIDKTIISGAASVGGGSTTFLSATLAVNGDGFLATALTVANTAGPFKFQAVALRVSADKVAFYRAKFTAFQDTLYAHSLRQFYRECTIVGTVDYMFGNAAAVFQKCNLLASTGILGQQNTLTAQGRTDKGMNTGFSFQACTVSPTKQLQSNLLNYKTYLGRPWKLYSRTVYMGCSISNIVDPAGWLPWNATFALDTLFYGEFRNTGPGAGVAKRVPWSTQMSARQTKKFLLKKLVSGTKWIPATGIPYGTTYLA